MRVKPSFSTFSTFKFVFPVCWAWEGNRTSNREHDVDNINVEWCVRNQIIIVNSRSRFVASAQIFSPRFPVRILAVSEDTFTPPSCLLSRPWPPFPRSPLICSSHCCWYYLFCPPCLRLPFLFDSGPCTTRTVSTWHGHAGTWIGSGGKTMEKAYSTLCRLSQHWIWISSNPPALIGNEKIVDRGFGKIHKQNNDNTPTNELKKEKNN